MDWNWSLTPHDLEILMKLGLSAILGMIIGLEREMKKKPVGLKTSLVISIVSCLLTVVSIESAYSFQGSDKVNVTMDPLRLAAQIVSGIGFLGAGVILRRDNNSISGLTTAAIIWGAAGIGIAVGSGFYVEAVAGVVLLIISVELLPWLLMMFGPKQLRQKEIYLRLTFGNKNDIEPVMEKIRSEKIKIKNIRIKDLDENQQYVQLRILVHQARKTTEVYYAISGYPEIRQVEIENI